MACQRMLSAAALIAAIVLCAGLAAASQLFGVLPGSSSLTIMDASFVHSPSGSFLSQILPQPPGSFTRSLGGTIVADEATGALEFADIDMLGNPLRGDQIMIDRRGNPRDIGDFALFALGFSFDDVGNAVLTGGQVDFDLSIGIERVSSASPIDLVGESASAMNMAGPPILSGSTLTIPVMIHFQDLIVVHGGAATFDLVGTIEANVIPEPSTLSLMSLGLVGCALYRRERRRS